MSSNAERVGKFDRKDGCMEERKKVRKERGLKLKYSEVEDRPG